MKEPGVLRFIEAVGFCFMLALEALHICGANASLFSALYYQAELKILQVPPAIDCIVFQSKVGN